MMVGEAAPVLFCVGFGSRALFLYLKKYYLLQFLAYFFVKTILYSSSVVIRNRKKIQRIPIISQSCKRKREQRVFVKKLVVQQLEFSKTNWAKAYILVQLFLMLFNLYLGTNLFSSVVPSSRAPVHQCMDTGKIE